MVTNILCVRDYSQHNDFQGCAFAQQVQKQLPIFKVGVTLRIYFFHTKYPFLAQLSGSTAVLLQSVHGKRICFLQIFFY